MIAGLILLLNSRQLCPVHRQMVTARLLQEQKKKFQSRLKTLKFPITRQSKLKCTLSGACKSQQKCSTFFQKYQDRTAESRFDKRCPF